MALTSEDIGKIAQLLKPLEQRIDGLEGKIGSLDDRIGGLDDRMNGLEGKIDDLDNRIGGLEGKADELERRFDHDFAEFRIQIAAFQVEFNSQFNEVQNNFDVLFSRDEKREQEYLMLRGQIARLEDRVQS